MKINFLNVFGMVLSVAGIFIILNSLGFGVNHPLVVLVSPFFFGLMVSFSGYLIAHYSDKHLN